ncbi:MAG: MATE family efflux transporter [Pseudomonadota bacterium]
MEGSNDVVSGNALVTEPVPPLIRQLAIPAGTGFLFNTLYNVIDSVYAGLWSTEALAALGASFPVFFLIIATMAGFGQGATGLMARALGADDRERARAIYGQALLVAVVLGIGVSILGIAVSVPVLSFLGLAEETRDLAADYLLPVMLAAPFFLANSVVNGLLTAQGNTRTYRNALIVGCIANIGLNPLFMFGFGLGVSGIAWATALVQVATLVYLLAVSRRNALGRPGAIRLQGRLLADLAAQSLPPIGNLTLIGISIFTITAFVAGHGDAAVAAYSVALRIEQLFMLPTYGLSSAALSLVGNNFGAGRNDRIALILRTTSHYGLLVMGTGAVVILLFREPLMLVFSRDPAVVAIGAQYLLAAAMIQIAYLVTMLGGSTLQGIGQPIWGLYVTIGRSLVAPLVVLTLVDTVLGLGLTGIFWSLVVINWTAALVMVMILRWRLKCDCGFGFGAVAQAGRAA